MSTKGKIQCLSQIRFKKLIGPPSSFVVVEAGQAERFTKRPLLIGGEGGRKKAGVL